MAKFVDRLRADAYAILDAVRGTCGLTFRQISEATDLSDQRIRLAIAYLIGAEAIHYDGPIPCGTNHASVWIGASSPPMPAFATLDP